MSIYVDQYVAGDDEDLCRFRNITAAYYRGAQGVVLVYDITNRKSFEKVDVCVQMEAFERYDLASGDSIATC